VRRRIHLERCLFRVSLGRQKSQVSYDMHVSSSSLHIPCVYPPPHIGRQKSQVSYDMHVSSSLPYTMRVSSSSHRSSEVASVLAAGSAESLLGHGYTFGVFLTLLNLVTHTSFTHTKLTHTDFNFTAESLLGHGYTFVFKSKPMHVSSSSLP